MKSRLATLLLVLAILIPAQMSFGQNPTTFVEPNPSHTSLLSVYSGLGNNVANTTNIWGATASIYNSTAYRITTTAGLAAWGNMGVRFEVNSNVRKTLADLSANYSHLHFDVWVASSGTSEFTEGALQLTLFTNASVRDYALPTISAGQKGSWVAYDIELSSLMPANLSQTLTGIQFINGNSVTAGGTFFIDNLYFYRKDTSVPQGPAIAPPSFTSVWPSSKVTSVFSDAYTNTPGLGTFTPAKVDFAIDGYSNQNTWRFNNTQNVTISGNLSLTDKNKFHIDVWTHTTKSFTIRLNGTITYPTSGTYTVTAGTWLPVDVDLPEGVNNITSIEILGTTSGTTYFVDNVYFYNDVISGESGSIFEANKALGRGINLGNGFEDDGYGSSGNAFSVPIAKDLIDKIANIASVAGTGNEFDHVRIPVRWDYGTRLATSPNGTGEYPINAGFLAEVKEIVDYTLSKNLKVILNVHHFNPLYAAPYSSERDRFLSIWRQLCNTFGNYTHDLYFEILNEPRDPMTYSIWNALIPDALSVIRTSGKNNQERPVLVGTSDWGGFPRLDMLNLPADNNLIATVHIYNPQYIANYDREWWHQTSMYVGIDWWDTQNERHLVETFFETADRFQAAYPGVPIHVGEYGTIKRTDTDARVLALTYLRNSFEQRGYSHSYWEFRAGYGFYDTSNGTYNMPVLDAILSNPLPKRPAAHTFAPKSVVYDINTNGSGGWSNINGSTATEVYKNFASGEEWGPSRAFPLAKSGTATYRISFKARVSDPDGHYLAVLSLAEPVGDNPKLEFVIYPETEEKEYIYTISLLQTGYDHRFSVRSNKIQTGKNIQLTIRDFRIEEVEKRHEAAPIPTASPVDYIYSSGNTGKSISFSGSGTKSNAKDNSTPAGNDIIQISNFASQTITLLSAVSKGSYTTLHLNAYAGSRMKNLTVKVNGSGGSVQQIFDLPSHEWQYLGINLGSLTTVSSIELSCPSGGAGRKLFLDHIFLQTGNVPANEEKIQAAPIPEKTSDVVSNIYSTKYGTANDLSFSDLGNKTQKTDENENQVIQLNNFTSQTVGFNGGGTLPIGNRNFFHVDFYPESRFQFRVKLIGEDAQGIAIEHVTGWDYTNPGSWNAIDLDIAGLGFAELESIQFISDKTSSSDYTVYLDHIYFYYHFVPNSNDPQTPAYLPPAINNTANVLSVFSDYYSSSVTPQFSQMNDVLDIEGDDIWRFSNTGDFELSFAPALDVSAMTHLHVDVWTGNTSATFDLSLDGVQYLASASTTTNEWLRLDIPLNSLSSVNTLSVLGTNAYYYIDNIYFYNDESPFTPSPIADVNNGLGKGMNLGELLDKAATYTVEGIKVYIDEIVALGSGTDKFGHIRLPIDWAINGRYAETAPHNLTPAFVIDTVKTIVDYALNNNLKVVFTLPSNGIVAGQIADYFRYYPEGVLFEIANNTPLANIRANANNAGRAVVIDQLIGLPVDNHIIASTNTIETGLNVWDDTSAARSEVNMALSGLSALTIPIYINAFGISTNADMDSRALWTTYIARYLESKSFSWAYWNYVGDYTSVVGNAVQKPILEALLYNKMPPPAIPQTTNSSILYDSEDGNLNAHWAGYDIHGSAPLSISGNTLTYTFNYGNGYGYPTLFQLVNNNRIALTQGGRYEIGFTASSTSGNYTYMVCFGEPDPENNDAINYVVRNFTPTTTEQNFSFLITYSGNTSPSPKLYFLFGEDASIPTGEAIHIKNIVVKELGEASFFESAPTQTHAPTDVKAVFSTQYGDMAGITFPAISPTVVSDVLDDNNNTIKLFSDFESQSITSLGGINLTGKNALHISAYPGSVLHLTVKATHGGNVAEKTITLEPHAWNELDINLSKFLVQTGGQITSVEFSGGTGEGRKLYLDHIYFYNKPDPVPDISVWTGSTDTNWNNASNWNENQVPEEITDVYIPGGLTSYPYLTGNKADNLCRNIYFLQGGELGRQDLLTYERAHVQFNYGLDGARFPQLTLNDASELPYAGDPGEVNDQLTGVDLEKHLQFSAAHSTKVGGNRFSGVPTVNARDRWIMLTSPLKGMASGDVSFAGYPTVYMQQIEVKAGVAQWTNPFSRTNIELQPGVGFVVFVRHGDDNGVLGNRETREENGGSRLSGLSQVNGIVEWPYHENPEMSAAHRIHEYAGGTSQFYYYGSTNFDVTDRYETFPRLGEENYRFIMEDGYGGQLTSAQIYAGSIASGSEMLVGNPFMSTIDFDNFQSANPHIGHYYRIWNGSGYNTYLTNGSGDYGTGGLSRYIAPMQSFLVSTLTELTTGLTLNYDIETLSVVPDANAYPGLRAHSSENKTELRIKAENAHSSSEALLVIKNGFSDSYIPTEDVYKLFTDIVNVPEVYSLQDEVEVEINCIGSSQNIDIPLGLKTNLLGATRFILSGMDKLNASIYLVDTYLDQLIDITGENEYEYSFENLVKGVQNERFILRIAEVTEEDTEELLDNHDLKVWWKDSEIHILSSQEDKIKEVVLYDIQGRVMYHKSGLMTSYYQLETVLDQTNAVYLLKVVTDQKVKNIKLTK